MSFSYAQDSLTIFSPTYFNEQKNIHEKISYLENEFLSFEFCTDENSQNITAILSCENESTELELYKNTNKKGCYFTNFNLENALCSNPKLEISYTLDNKFRKITRHFQKERQSELINHVIGNNIDFLTSEELSYYLIVLNDMETENSILSEKVYDMLKNSRNNQNKCWPATTCNMRTTTNILKNLKFAGYDIKSRLIDDGKTYLERNMINNENYPTKFVIEMDYEFNESEFIRCSLKIDDDTEKNYEFEKGYETLDNKASEKISLNCERSVDINLEIYNTENRLIKIEEFKNTNSITYNFDKFSCIGTSGRCDFESSLNALIVYGNQIKDYTLIENYINNYKIERNAEKYIDNSDSILDTSRYLFYKSNSDFTDFIKFSQNNDGSWGSGSNTNRIIKTSWAILGLQKNSQQTSSENIRDGKKWVYNFEPVNGWGDIQKNTYAYLAIKEQIKPYVAIEVKNILEETNNFTITNPTVYTIRGIKLSFSNDIDKHLSYSQNLGDLFGKENTSFIVSIADKFYGQKTGTLKLTGFDSKNREITLIEMPINLVGPTPFSIERNINAPFSMDYDKITIPLKEINNPFSATCSYTNPFNNKKEEITISERTTEIILENPTLKEGVFDFVLNCDFMGVKFSQNSILNSTFIQETFSTIENSANLISLDDFIINVNNFDTERKIFSFSIEGPLRNAITPTEETKIIAAGDTRQVFFKITNPELFKNIGNTTDSNIIIRDEDSGYAKKIPIEINIDNFNDEGSSLMLYLIIGLITFLIVSLLIIRYLRNSRAEDIGDTYEGEEEGLYFDEKDINFK